jgi:uncharacterized protein
MTDESAELTGNDYVTIPSITRACAMDGLNVIHGGLGGLVEWTGTGADVPLLRPELLVDGTPVSLSASTWRRLDRWIPAFQLTLPDGLVLHGTICAPGGYPAARGALLRFELENRSQTNRQITLRLHITWTLTNLWIASGRPLDGVNRLLFDGNCVCLEAASGRGPALAISGTHALALSGGTTRAAPLAALPAGALLDAINGTTLHAVAEQTFAVQPQRRGTACCFIGAGRERDGACAAATALRRAGPDHWLHQARLELSHMVRAGEDPQRSELLNRNLLFNRYFAVGRGIDDDRLYLLRSRSTSCPAPALFNEREALFWTIPALIVADPGLAREAIFRVFDAFSERAGEYLRYIDGGTYDPAFVLDQLLLYPWIADYYVRTSGDETLLDEPLLRQVIIEADTALFLRLHAQHMLCSTDLLPSGDATDHPYPTVGNVLLWAFCDALPRLWSRAADEPPLRLEGAASEVAAAIWQHCTTELEGVAVLASSASLDGEVAVYDDPTGTLALLPFFGFCPADDPLWSDTMEFLRSQRYPLWRDGAVPGLATRSDRAHARLAALCADLLGPAQQHALERLTRLHLPAGVAAGGYATDAAAVVEPYHAALAGFLAWTLPRAQEKQARTGRGAKQRTS